MFSENSIKSHQETHYLQRKIEIKNVFKKKAMSSIKITDPLNTKRHKEKGGEEGE